MAIYDDDGCERCSAFCNICYCCLCDCSCAADDYFDIINPDRRENK